MTCRFKIDMRNLMNFKGLIKSTDHRPLTHRPTDQLTTDAPTHRPNGPDSISKT